MAVIHEPENVVPAQEPPQASLRSVCDGVICFGGEDWWYHNRGHYDMQMMREASRDVPVLYVNSIGMRRPRVGEGRMFLARVRRKVRSLRRGLVKVRKDFSVFSPVVVPGRIGQRLTGWSLGAQVRRAARRCGIARPLVWVACPPAAGTVEDLSPNIVVYQRTDRFEAFPNVDFEAITACDRFLKDRADLTLFCSRHLFDQERDTCRSPAFVDHGVDFDRFEAAGREGVEPADAAPIARPRVGFVGGIDSHTFDPPLFVEVARRLGDVQFVLVGACSLPAGWCDLPNVHLLGQRAYQDVPAYMAACDVLIMPWNDGDWIKACNPVKLKEYLAVGRPVVSTAFDELRAYEGLVHVAKGPEQFAAAIRAALDDGSAPDRGRDRVRQETWAAKADQIVHLLRERRGLE